MTNDHDPQHRGDWKQSTKTKTQAHAEAEFPETEREEEENEKQRQPRRWEEHRSKRISTKHHEEQCIQKEGNHRSLSSLLDEEKELADQVQSILKTVKTEVRDIPRGHGLKLPTELLENIIDDEGWKHVPREMNQWLAREIGAHTGDMHLYIDDQWHYRFDVYGHITEQAMYLLGCIVPLELIVYGLEPSRFYKPHRDQTLVATYFSKPAVLFKSRVIGLPVGKKRHIIPPSIIREHRDLMCNYVCEICSTDGLIGFYDANKKYNVHKYPKIQIRMTLKEVIETSAGFVRQELGMDAKTYYDIKRENGSIQHALVLNGEDNLDLWREMIGVSNPSKISRVMVWEKYGMCPPRTTLLQRFAMISDIINPLTYKKRNQRIPPVKSLPKEDIIDILSKMRKHYGYPLIRPTTLLDFTKTVDRLVHIRNQRLLLQSSSSFSSCSICIGWILRERGHLEESVSI